MGELHERKQCFADNWQGAPGTSWGKEPCKGSRVQVTRSEIQGEAKTASLITSENSNFGHGWNKNGTKGEKGLMIDWWSERRLGWRKGFYRVGGRSAKMVKWREGVMKGPCCEQASGWSVCLSSSTPCRITRICSAVLLNFVAEYFQCDMALCLLHVCKSGHLGLALA